MAKRVVGRGAAGTAPGGASDRVTGLPDRDAFLARLRRAAARRAAPGGSAGAFAVVDLDLDHFRAFNRANGYAPADEALGVVARRLRAAVAEADVVARVGADEFAVLSEGTDEDAAACLAARLLRAVGEPFILGGRHLALAASAGVAVGRGGEEAEFLLGEAEAAVDRARRLGGSTYWVFDAEARERSSRRLEAERALPGALERGELALRYEPQVDLRTGRVVGFEALLRWQWPGVGPVPPAEFVPLAEESGLIVGLGAWVLGEACRVACSWPLDVRSGLGPTVTVNLSPRQLLATSLVATVGSALSASGLDPARLVLEITEGAFAADPGVALVTLRSLRSLGVSLALDDFGVGFSALGRLKRCPEVDALKIDRSFVTGLGRNPGDTAIVAAVIQLARALDLAVVAEGVETAEHASALVALGCGVGQGRWLGEPVAPERTPATVERRAEGGSSG